MFRDNVEIYLCLQMIIQCVKHFIYMARTTFHNTLRTIKHHQGMSPSWQHLCEYTPRHMLVIIKEFIMTKNAVGIE